MVSRYFSIGKGQLVSELCTNNTVVLLYVRTYIRYSAQRYSYVNNCIIAIFIIHTYVHTYVRTYVRTYIHAYTYVRTCLIYIICTYVRMYIRTCAHQCAHKLSIVPVFIHPAQKLTHIEMEFSSRHSNDVASVDDRLAFYQRQCDQRAKQQVKLEVRTVIIPLYVYVRTYIHTSL